MIKVKFGTGENIEVEALTTVYDAAAAAGLISRSVIACRIGDKVCDLTTPIAEDSEITLLTFEGALKENGTDTSDDGGRRTFWHTASHILAQAVKTPLPRNEADDRTVDRKRLLLRFRQRYFFHARASFRDRMRR